MVAGNSKANLTREKMEHSSIGSGRAWSEVARITGVVFRCVSDQTILNIKALTDLVTTGRSAMMKLRLFMTRLTNLSVYSDQKKIYPTNLMEFSCLRQSQDCTNSL